MSSAGDDDPLLTALRRLPGHSLSPSARAAALAGAEAELRAVRDRRWRWRWPGGEALVPAVLVMGGLLYLSGALQALDRIYGPAQRSANMSIDGAKPVYLVANKSHQSAWSATENGCIPPAGCGFARPYNRSSVRGEIRRIER